MSTLSTTHILAITAQKVYLHQYVSHAPRVLHAHRSDTHLARDTPCVSVRHGMAVLEGREDETWGDGCGVDMAGTCVILAGDGWVLVRKVTRETRAQDPHACGQCKMAKSKWPSQNDFSSDLSSGMT